MKGHTGFDANFSEMSSNTHPGQVFTIFAHISQKMVYPKYEQPHRRWGPFYMVEHRRCEVIYWSSIEDARLWCDCARFGSSSRYRGISVILWNWRGFDRNRALSSNLRFWVNLRDLYCILHCISIYPRVEQAFERICLQMSILGFLSSNTHPGQVFTIFGIISHPQVYPKYEQPHRRWGPSVKLCEMRLFEPISRYLLDFTQLARFR